MVYRYPKEVHEFVKEWAPKLRDRDLAEACNKELGTSFTAHSIKAFRGNHGYRNGYKQYTKEEYWKYQKRYPQGMYEFIRDNSWGVSSKEMARMTNEKFGTNWTQTGMKQFRQRHGIKSGVTGWYRKGNPPATKGKKQSEYCSPEAIERSKKTRFKKGNIPHNTLPVGTIRANGHGDLIVKVQETGGQWERWRYLSRVVWEQHNGPIPEGMAVSFKNGDRSDCSIENLMLISRGENAALTRMHYRFEDPEMTEVGLNIVRLRQAAAKKKRENKRTERRK